MSSIFHDILHSTRTRPHRPRCYHIHAWKSTKRGKDGGLKGRCKETPLWSRLEGISTPTGNPYKIVSTFQWFIKILEKKGQTQFDLDIGHM